MWFKLFLLVVANLLASALAPRPPAPKAAALEDFDIPEAAEGRPIPVVFGTVTVTGPNVLWYGDLSTSPIRSAGGKK